jgi:hypothetical protein
VLYAAGVVASGGDGGHDGHDGGSVWQRLAEQGRSSFLVRRTSCPSGWWMWIADGG